jgi:DNA primase
MDRIELQKLRELPIEGVAQRLGLSVVRHKALCPFHDDHHASLSFSVRRNSFRCFVCGASGGTIDLVMRHLNLGFREACKWLGDENCIILTEYQPQTSYISHQTSFDASRYERYFERPWLNEAARKFLYEERRLDPRVVRWCRLTSWTDRQGVSWLQIPYYNNEGKLVGVQNRNLVRGGSPRFRFPQGSQCGIYNLPVLSLLRPGESLYITEGCSDCWAMLSAGHKAIAIPSATLLTNDVRCKMEEVRARLDINFHMFPDRDEPGERLFLQLQQVLPSLVHHQLPPGCKDFGEYFSHNRDGPFCEK